MSHHASVSGFDVNYDEGEIVSIRVSHREEARAFPRIDRDHLPGPDASHIGRLNRKPNHYLRGTVASRLAWHLKRRDF